MKEEELSVLLCQLDEAFGHLPIPSAGRLIRDDCLYGLEASEIHEKFRGRHWRDLNVGDLLGEADSLAYFTPEAFRFFLPAFIRISLLDPEAADLIPDAILWSLAQPEDSKLWKEKEELYLETARVHAMPEAVISELAAIENAEYNDAFCKKRIAELDNYQKEAVINFIRFTRKYRPAGELVARHLDRAEDALR